MAILNLSVARVASPTRPASPARSAEAAIPWSRLALGAIRPAMIRNNRRLAGGILRASLALGALGAEIPPALGGGMLGLVPSALAVVPYVAALLLGVGTSSAAPIATKMTMPRTMKEQ